ncbi:MAG TPA: PucR family transcriptional regulator, partial [Arthrobacter sp.]|nr:PucR family transcriptional regulator [Arthrobacter sp.]
MHNVDTFAHTTRWTELVDQLDGRLDELARAFTSRVREIPEYGESQVTVQEIQETARETFRRLIR